MFYSSTKTAEGDSATTRYFLSSLFPDSQISHNLSLFILLLLWPFFGHQTGVLGVKREGDIWKNMALYYQKFGESLQDAVQEGPSCSLSIY